MRERDEVHSRRARSALATVAQVAHSELVTYRVTPLNVFWIDAQKDRNHWLPELAKWPLFLPRRMSSLVGSQMGRFGRPCVIVGIESRGCRGRWSRQKRSELWLFAFKEGGEPRAGGNEFVRSKTVRL